MTVMTRKSEQLLNQLIAFAGDGELVHRALRELNIETGAPPTLEAVARRIVALRPLEESAAPSTGNLKKMSQGNQTAADQ
jgi:hypothetical protein